MQPGCPLRRADPIGPPARAAGRPRAAQEGRVPQRSRLRQIVVALALAAGAAAAEEAGETRPVGVLTDLEGPIGPAATRHVAKTLEAARQRGAEVVILRINTPGGLATSMRDIIEEILASSVPVVGYVAPSGAHAASAGTYILYATHVAAMAPGTNLGAATPVMIGGGGLPGLPSGEDEKGEDKTDGEGEGDGEAAKATGSLETKAVEDAAALIRGLAEMHGRNAVWAEKAVREAASLSASEALAEHVIEVVAADVDALLVALDGRVVTVGKAERTLATSGLALELIEPDFLTKVLGVLANPNVAFMLMMLGVYGLIFEFANPGSIAPGVVGSISLILGLYALNQLPLDYAGLALVVLGIAMMLAEAFTPAFGVLGLGGIAAFVIGAAMLFDTDVPAYQLSWWVVGGSAATSGLLLILVLHFVFVSHRRVVVSGAEQMVGAAARVVDWSGETGHVRIEGERWRARANRAFEPGELVRVNSMDGLTLQVEAAPARANDDADLQGG